MAIMGTRRKSRELVLQMLFQADMGKQTPELVRKTFWAERSNVEEEDRGFADDLFRVAIARMPEIDGLIGKHTQHWRMDRMATVDRNVLRGAVAEFLGYPATPRAVVINEALEIARKFSAPRSAKIPNKKLEIRSYCRIGDCCWRPGCEPSCARLGRARAPVPTRTG